MKYNFLTLLKLGIVRKNYRSERALCFGSKVSTIKRVLMEHSCIRIWNRYFRISFKLP
jgi:hypothetical protein